MKKLINYAIVFAASLGLASCGGSSKADEETNAEEVKMQVQPDVNVKGPLAEYFTVVNRPYTIKKDGGGYMVTIEVERNDEYAPFDDDICYFSQGKDSEASYIGGFGYEILDEDGDIIAKAAPDGAAYGFEEMSLALRTPLNQSNSIQFKLYDLNGTPATIRITSDVRPNDRNVSGVKTISDAADKALSDIQKEVSDADEDLKNAAEAGKQAVEAGKQAVELLNGLSKML